MDINTLQQLLNKLDLYPEEVQYYFHSNQTTATISELSKKFNLPEDKNELFFDALNGALLNDFDFSFLDALLGSGLSGDEIIKEAGVDFIGRLILPIAQYVKKDIMAEFSRRGGVVSNYIPYIQRFQIDMEGAKVKVMEDVIKKFDMDLDREAEMKDAVSLFAEDCFAILNDVSPNRLIGLNGMLIFLMINKEEFHRELETALLENQEVLTGKPFRLSGNPTSPTIGNWLHDFIAKYGTGIFTNVMLSEFLSSGENAKILDKIEKGLVAKLLVIYRNIKFFPQTFADLPQEQWQVIPIDHLIEKNKLPEKIESPMGVKNGIDPSSMSLLELKAFMEANNLSREDIEKMKKK